MAMESLMLEMAEPSGDRIGMLLAQLLGLIGRFIAMGGTLKWLVYSGKNPSRNG